MATPAWNTGADGYRAFIKTDYPATALVYASPMTMAVMTPMAPLSTSRYMWGDLSSANVIVVGTPGNYLLAGALTAFRSLTMLRAVYENRRITRIEIYQPDIRPGETPEETILLEGEDWRELLCTYADKVAAKMGAAPVVSDKNLTGYCSWYYYYKDVTEQHFLENVDALAKNRSPYAAEYVQIDDGYQTFQGDWLDQKQSWPTPLKEIARRITDAGMKAGIWTMPTTASTASRVFREHPDWFVRDTQGEVVTLPGWSPEPDNIWACLDATIPEAREHIANIFKTFRSWGFTYFKMDGLYFGFQKGVRRNPDATAVSAFRLLLKTIRDAVPDALLMACSSPFMPCIGLVDNIRASNDTSRYFRDDPQNQNAPMLCGCNILDAFHLTLGNFWWFDRWFRADPDVVMARQDYAFYTRNQAKFSVLGAIATGLALTSDHLGTISPERNALLAKAQNIRMRQVRPIHSTPNMWPLEYEGTIDGKRAVILTNDTPSPKTWLLSDLALPEECIDLLDDKPVHHEVTLEPDDAMLLTSR